MYNFQDYKESKASTHAHNKECSKQIIDLLYKSKLNLIEIYNDIIKKSRDYNFFIKSKINLTPINLQDTKEIICPKFKIKQTTQTDLAKPFGLTNPEIYNLLNNSNLPICYNNKSFYTLENDLRIYLREPDATDYIDFVLIDNNIVKTVNKYISFPYCLGYLKKGYMIELSNRLEKIRFVRNSIIDIEFTNSEWNNLDKLITNCNERYIFIYCSQLPFNKKGFDKIKANFKGGHKASIIIDKQQNEIVFFDPFGLNIYSVFNDYSKYNTYVINVILPLALSKNLYSLNKYKYIYAAETIAPQSLEYTYINEVYNYNIEQILDIKKTEKQLQDWAGGYCGLWNYLYMFLLLINPHMDLINIHNFIYKMTNIKYSPMFVKLFIKNFAYYIENALVTPNYVIPLTKLDITQLNDENINAIKLSSNNNIKLHEMNELDYYKKTIVIDKKSTQQ